MSYQVLARKWRPKHFKDVVGQSHITQTLINSIRNNKVGHAYLLTGTRGVGKTTIARIFAKAIRCENLSPEGEPCLECSSCTSIESTNSLDYQEVDGASNNSVDDMRDLIENVQYLPTSGKYKVYVIDEVHMLSVSAFNALLKTLEEPPEHVVFIFATTDPQKLLGTVLSRCQRFDFKNSNVEDTKSLLLEIASSEGIKFENDDYALELAKQGKGSFRDSLSLFDQVISLSNSNTITEESLMLSLGMAKTKSVNMLLNAILGRQKLETTNIYNSVLDENIDLKIFTVQILDKLYNLLVNIDDKGNLNSTDLDDDIIQSISLVEVMWVYETLSKDLEWALSSFDPEKTCGFSFIKSAIREKILLSEDTNISLKKNSKVIEADTSSPIISEVEIKPIEIKPVEIQESVITPEPEAVLEPIIAEENPEQDKPVVNEVEEAEKSWELFIKFLYKNSKAVAVNLERGNLLNNENFLKKGAHLRVAFTLECKIFKDFLSDPEPREILITLLAEYLNFEEGDIDISLEIIDEDTKEKSNFMSSVHIEEDKIEQDRKNRKSDILSNKYIQDAETLFSSKIDKVILNDKE